MFKYLLASTGLALPALTQMLLQQMTEQALGPVVDPNGSS